MFLYWTPSDIVVYEENFVTVSFENSERMNFTHRTDLNYFGYKYEMHRLVKVAWNKVEQYAPPLYDMIRQFKFETSVYQDLLALYDQHRHNKTVKQVACMWMQNKKNIWRDWIRTYVNAIYIGKCFV